jgi:hypothetical protein
LHGSLTEPHSAPQLAQEHAKISPAASAAAGFCSVHAVKHAGSLHEAMQPNQPAQSAFPIHGAAQPL